MIFLIEYNSAKSLIVTFDKFEERDREKAEDKRLTIELDLHRRGIQHEVVLLEAENDEILHRTHRRYFESANQIVISSTG
jgi:hypothetical protein